MEVTSLLLTWQALFADNFIRGLVKADWVKIKILSSGV